MSSVKSINLLSNKNLRFTFFTIFLLFQFSNAYSQKEGNWWYFGSKAGLDFNRIVSGLPTTMANGAMVTQEGCATISDKNGNLLFYTNGSTVWNRNHIIMSNGTGLLGNFSSTQSAIIVPFPNNVNKYYIFTIWTSNTSGFRYSVVDMSLSSGLGGVVTSSKNTLIFSPTCERVTATERIGGGYWVLAQHKLSNRYSAYAITSSGVSTTAVTTSIGPIPNANGIGYMKFSPKGDKLGVGYRYTPTSCFLLDFNKSTGVLSNLREDVTATAYGIEFSPNGNFLYTSSGNGTILQYDANASTSSTFAASAVTFNTPGNRSFNIQLGPDGKIYISNYLKSQLGVIHNPNIQGTGCNLSLSGPILPSGALCRIGFPTFVQSFFFPQAFQVNDICGKDYAYFSYGDTASIDSLLFNFGDPSTGLKNFSVNHIDSHKYSKPGKYKVTLFLFRMNGSKLVRDTLTDSLTVFKRPIINIGNDTSVCAGVFVNIKTDSVYSWYDWDTGDTTQQITAKSTGIYIVKAGTPFCYGTDSIQVSWMRISKPFLGNDTSVCDVDSFRISSNKTYENYNWSTSQKTKSININKTGRYWIQVDSAGCINRDTINIKITNPPLGFTLGDDKQLCKGKTLVLKPDTFSGNLLWSNGEITNSIVINKPGKYSLKMKIEQCEFKTEVLVSQLFPPTIALANDTFICKFSELELHSFGKNINSQLWNNGDIEESIIISEGGNYWVSTKNTCGSSSDTITVTEKDCECIINIPNVFTPNNDGVNDLFYIDYTCPFSNYKIDIYDRWGRLMFSSTDFENHWNGTVRGNGKSVTNGVYFWVMTYQFSGGEEVKDTGHVTVLSK